MMAEIGLNPNLSMIEIIIYAVVIIIAIIGFFMTAYAQREYNQETYNKHKIEMLLFEWR